MSKSLELLAWLALHGPSSREELINALWEGKAKFADGRYFKVALQKLRIALRHRIALDFDPIPFQNGLYRINPILELKVDTGPITQALYGSDKSLLHAALMAYKGPFMKGISSEWVEMTRQSLRDEVIGVVIKLGQMLEVEDAEAALEIYYRGIAIDSMSLPLLDTMTRLLTQLNDGVGLQRLQRIRDQALE